MIVVFEYINFLFFYFKIKINKISRFNGSNMVILIIQMGFLLNNIWILLKLFLIKCYCYL